MGHTEGRAEQSRQETSFWFLFLLHSVGLVQFKPALCSGINWKAAAKLQLAFFAFCSLHAEVLMYMSALSCGFSQYNILFIWYLMAFDNLSSRIHRRSFELCLSFPLREVWNRSDQESLLISERAILKAKRSTTKAQAYFCAHFHGPLD